MKFVRQIKTRNQLYRHFEKCGLTDLIICFDKSLIINPAGMDLKNATDTCISFFPSFAWTPLRKKTLKKENAIRGPKLWPLSWKF